MQAGSGTVADDGVLGAGDGGEGALELGDLGSGGQPVAAQYLGDRGDVVFVDVVAAIGKKGARRQGHNAGSRIILLRPSTSSHCVLVSLA